jgi:PAS domain S-box-containing protein
MPSALDWFRRSPDRRTLGLRDMNGGHDASELDRVSITATPRPVEVLIVDDDPVEAHDLSARLCADSDETFETRCVDRLATALERVSLSRPDVILVDLDLADSRGVDTFAALYARAAGVPIIILTDPQDIATANAMLRGGAQDIIVRGEAHPGLLARTIRSAIERKRADVRIRGLTEHLEQRVLDRTKELEVANAELAVRRRELQDFIDAMSTMNAKIACDGTMVSVNRIAQRASGYPIERLIGTNFLDAQWWTFDPEVQTRVRHAFTSAVGGALVSYEERMMAFGKVITILLTLVPVAGPNGNVGYIVAEGRDISRRIEVEDALKAANQELEAFTYSVSHDLRAPIRQIDGFSRLLIEQFGEVLDPRAQHYLTRVRDSTARMGRLVDDLLRLSQLGRQDMRPRLASLNDVLHEVIAEMQTDVAERDVEWKLAPLPRTQCDPGLVKVVFTNLLANAVKYTRPRQPAIIEVGAGTRNGRGTIFVRDNGVGFDMRYADRLFGVFQRLHRADEFEGTGVGLATVQRIIHKHGGEIWVDAAPDRGAAFHFTLGPG